MKKILVMTLIAGLGLSGLTGCKNGAAQGGKAPAGFRRPRKNERAARQNQERGRDQQKLTCLFHPSFSFP